MRAKPGALSEGEIRSPPTDEELVAFITEPMKSVDVASHFEMDGPVCLRRLAKMVKYGRLARPFYGFYAPLGSSVERPLPPLHSKVLDTLGEPRTAMEISELLGVGYSVTRVLQTLMQCGHVVHCGHLHYLRADVADLFAEPWFRSPQEGRRPPGAVREAILSALVEPRSVSYLAVGLGETHERVTGQLIALVKAGKVVRFGRMGNPAVLHFKLTEPPTAPTRPRRSQAKTKTKKASRSRARS